MEYLMLGFIVLSAIIIVVDSVVYSIKTLKD